MTRSKRLGTADLSRQQRASLADFRRKNFNLLKNFKVHEIVKIWRDGFICGAIHGYDHAKLEQHRLQLRLMKRINSRNKSTTAKRGRGRS
jgi:hypothetical protein